VDVEKRNQASEGRPHGLFDSVDVVFPLVQGGCVDGLALDACACHGGARTYAPCRSASRESAPRAQAVEHPGDAIQERLAGLDVVRADVAPRDRHAQCGT
jgi:hypothetical protein